MRRNEWKCSESKEFTIRVVNAEEHSFQLTANTTVTSADEWGLTMKPIKFVITGRLNNLNDYTKACRGSRYSGADMKRKNEALISACIREQVGDERITGPIYFDIHWYESNSRRDPDNVSFAKKFIFDALVKEGVIEGDEWKYVKGFSEYFSLDKENPRVEVTIYPRND